MKIVSFLIYYNDNTKYLSYYYIHFSTIRCRRHIIQCLYFITFYRSAFIQNHNVCKKRVGMPFRSRLLSFIFIFYLNNEEIKNIQSIILYILH